MEKKVCSKCKVEKPLSNDNFRWFRTRGAWGAQCKKCIKKYKQEYYAKNKEFVKKTNKSRQKKYYELNKELVKTRAGIRAKEHKEYIRKYKREYYQKNKDKLKAQARLREKGPEYRLRKSVRTLVDRALKSPYSNKGGESIFDYLPYTKSQLLAHIESQFEPWMNWDNYGKSKCGEKTWSLDHIVPRSEWTYDSMDHPEFLLCWALDNLRPIDSSINAQKGNRHIKASVCLDFDGVVYSYKSGFVGIDYLPDKPVTGAFEAITNYINNDLRVYIFSTRCAWKAGRKAIKRWLLENCLDFDIVKKIKIPKRKPIAKLYIDDRGFQFNGRFPSTDFVDNFVPWHGGSSSSQK